MSNANILYTSFVKAEATYRARRRRDDVAGSDSSLRRSRPRRRAASDRL